MTSTTGPTTNFITWRTLEDGKVHGAEVSDDAESEREFRRLRLCPGVREVRIVVGVERRRRA